MPNPNEITDRPMIRAAKVVGSQMRLSLLIGVSRSAISQWVTGSARVPIRHCPAIERATDGAVRCEELRPDVAWQVLRTPAGG